MVAGLAAFGVAIATVDASPRTTSADAPLAFRAVVPGLAVDSGPGEQPGQMGVAHLSARVDGGLVVTGEVVNHCCTPITNVRVRIVYTSGGTTLSKDTESLVSTISNGGTGPFRATFIGVTADDGTLRAEVIGFEAAAAPAPSASVSVTGAFPFQIGPPDPQTKEIPYSTEVQQLRGTVTNTSSTSLTGMQVVLAAYDGNGNVAFVTTSSLITVPFQATEMDPVLLPGTTGAFIASIPLGRLLEIEGAVTWRGYLNATPAQ